MSQPTVSHIIRFLDSWAPERTQLEYDNSGLLAGSARSPVSGILTCLDVTHVVLDEALATGADLIVAHHPLIFRKLSRLDPDDPTGALLYRIVREGLALYAAHTNLDAARGGVSHVLAETLGLGDLAFLSPESDSHGFGMVGRYEEPLSEAAFLARVAEALGAAGIRTAGKAGRIGRVAVCGGAGAGLIGAARAAGADAYVTADLKYHDFFLATDGFLLVDAGHYETEAPVIERLRRELQTAFPDTRVRATSQPTNPISYDRSLTTSR